MLKNIHREDLSPTEKGKFCLKIKKQMKLENNEQVANVLKINSDDVYNWVDDFQARKSLRVGNEISHTTLRATRTLPDKERKEIIKFAEKEGKSGSFIEEDLETDGET